MLLKECEKTHLVDIKTSCEVKAVTCSAENHFLVATNLGYFQAESVVVASGGLSIPTLGGSGIGYEIAKQFGHHIFPTRAGLVPFTFSDQFKEVTTRLSGNAIEATLSNDLNSFTEALLFTHRGLSIQVHYNCPTTGMQGRLLISIFYQVSDCLISSRQKNKLSLKFC